MPLFLSFFSRESFCCRSFFRCWFPTQKDKLIKFKLSLLRTPGRTKFMQISATDSFFLRKQGPLKQDIGGAASLEEELVQADQKHACKQPSKTNNCIETKPTQTKPTSTTNPNKLLLLVPFAVSFLPKIAWPCKRQTANQAC